MPDPTEPSKPDRPGTRDLLHFRSENRIEYERPVEIEMAYKVSTVEVWAGDLLNRPGTLARALEALSVAGAQLEFIVARRVTANTSRVFVAPLRNTRQKKSAEAVELRKADGMHVVRIEGPDRAGLAARISRALADHDINIRGVSGATIGRKTVLYFALQTAETAKLAMKEIRRALSKPRRV